MLSIAASAFGNKGI